MRFILDADILVYEAATTAELTVRWPPSPAFPAGDLYTTTATLGAAQAKFIDTVSLWITSAGRALGMSDAEIEAADVTYAFSDPERGRAYRKQLPLVDYKAQRLGMRRPIVCNDLEAWAIAEFDGQWEPTLEGDDICGIVQGLSSDESVIVTHDKDLLQIPGYVWQPRKQELVRVTRESGDRFFYTQVLTGDRVDGYTGIPNVGPVAAKKILDKAGPGEEWDAIVEAYRKKGLSEEFALNTARCARILRAGEFDFTKKEVLLWQPTA